MEQIPLSELRKWNLFRNLRVDLLKSVWYALVTNKGATGYLVTTSDDVYAVGSNQCGAFGIGTDQTEFSITPIKVDALSGQEIMDLQMGVRHGVSFNVALTKDGRVYTWGQTNYTPQCYSLVLRATLSEALAGVKVSQIACSEQHTLALTYDGKVYSWGCNHLGKLGIDGDFRLTFLTLPEQKLNNIPQKIDALSSMKVTSISVGNNHSCALTDSGEVYMWGSNVNGQLGIDDMSVIKSNAPAPIPLLKFKKVLCGATHVIGLSTKGKVYCWGSNEKAQLGFADETRKQYAPKKHHLPPVDDIAVNRLGNFNACRTKAGDYFLWGDVSKHNGFQSCICSPLKVFCNSFMELLSFHHYYPQMHDALTCFNALKNVSTQFEMDFILADNGNSYTDVVFDVQGQQLRAHMNVLRQNSRYFAAVLENHDQTTHDTVIQIWSEIRYEPFFALVYFIYSNDLMFPQQPGTLKDLHDLLLLADIDILPKLKPLIENVLLNSITVDNVVALFNLFSSHIEGVQKFATQFMTRNLREIADTGTLGQLRKGVLAEIFTEFLNKF